MANPINILPRAMSLNSVSSPAKTTVREETSHSSYDRLFASGRTSNCPPCETKFQRVLQDNYKRGATYADLIKLAQTYNTPPLTNERALEITMEFIEHAKRGMYVYL